MQTSVNAGAPGFGVKLEGDTGPCYHPRIMQTTLHLTDHEDALLRGSACAAIVVAKPGCAPAMPVPPELDAFLTTHPGPTAP